MGSLQMKSQMIRILPIFLVIALAVTSTRLLLMTPLWIPPVLWLLGICRMN